MIKRLLLLPILMLMFSCISCAKEETDSLSIIVDRVSNRLTLATDNKEMKSYSVVTDSETPTGKCKIATKIKDPIHYRQGTLEPSGSPDNVLGSRWMGFDGVGLGYGIIGDYELNIKKGGTSGCISMKDKEIEELYDIVPIGTEVIIK